MSNMRLSKMKFPNDENIYDVIDSNSFVNVNHSDGQYTFTKEDGNTVSVKDNSVTRTATSETGSRVLELTDAAAAPLIKCVTDITGSQDLHGYDKPWVGGAGVNKFPTDTLNINLSSSGTQFMEFLGKTVNTTYTIAFISDKAFSCKTLWTLNTDTINISVGLNILHETTRADIHGNYNMFYVTTDLPLPGNVTLTNVFIAVGNIPDNQYVFSPYENICPITAYTEGEIEVSDGDGNTNTSTATFTNDIYKGSADFVNCTATTEWGMIASYAGETLPGEWISDRDEYVPGTTPTTGAQVAYELATPTTSPVTPTNIPIKSLSGYNHIESSTGDMEVEYITSEYQPIVDLITSSAQIYKEVTAQEYEDLPDSKNTDGIMYFVN